MLNRILIRQYISQSLLLFFGCGLVIFSFAWIRVWVVSLLDMSQFETILEQFRDFEKFAPIDFDSLMTYTGRVGMTYDEPIVILCIVIWCVSRGSDVVSGELGRGTLEMLVAQPIKRTTLLVSHALVGIGGLALLCLLVWAGIAIGIENTSVEEAVDPPSFRIPIINFEVPLNVDEPATETVPLNQRVDAKLYAASTFHLFSFGFFLLALSSMVSCFDRYRWRTVGAVVSIYIIQLVVFGLGKAAESLSWLLSWTFFSCYKPQKTVLLANENLANPWSLTETLEGAVFPPLVYPLILISLGLVCYAVAGARFASRDLPAPL